MNRLFSLLFLLSLAGESRAATDDVVLLGHFSNQKITRDADPHYISGYSVSLYQSGQTYFGKIGVAVGSPEPVPGRLYDIKFDPASKKLNFKVKYSDGNVASKETGPAGRESRVQLTFSGKLTRKSLAGTVVLKDGYSPEKAGIKTYEVMKRKDDDDKPKSLAEWKEYAPPEVDW